MKRIHWALPCALAATFIAGCDEKRDGAAPVAGSSPARPAGTHDASAPWVENQLGGIDVKDPEFANKVLQAWQKVAGKLSPAPVPSVADPAVAGGARLPKELVEGLGTTTSRSPEDSPQDKLNQLGFYMVMTRPDLLAQCAQERADKLPPSEADLALYKALMAGVEELNPSGTRGSFEAWKPLENAKNPVYRLLALEAAVRSTAKETSGLSSEDQAYNNKDGLSKLPFYLTYVNETDPFILQKALRMIASVPTDEARQALLKIQAEKRQSGDVALQSAIAEALNSHELISRSADKK